VNFGRKADAVVVLGCRVGRHGAASTALRHRIDCGVRLFRDGAAPLLVLSGGGAGPVPEAETKRRAALAMGVPEAALLIEARSRNTFENARETAGLLKSRGLRSVLLVSHRPHLPRAIVMFRLTGLEVMGWAGASAPSLCWEFAAVFHECAALPKSLTLALLYRGSFRRPFRRFAKGREDAPEQQGDAERGASCQQE
jgi:uncharacterized SAM-binding protein YcdF (DUF218 family)